MGNKIANHDQVGTVYALFALMPLEKAWIHFSLYSDPTARYQDKMSHHWHAVIIDREKTGKVKSFTAQL